MFELINLFGLSNSPDLPIEFLGEDQENSSESSGSSSSSLHTSFSEGIDKIQVQSVEDHLVLYKKVEVANPSFVSYFFQINESKFYVTIFFDIYITMLKLFPQTDEQKLREITDNPNIKAEHEVKPPNLFQVNERNILK